MESKRKTSGDNRTVASGTPSFPHVPTAVRENVQRNAFAPAIRGCAATSVTETPASAHATATIATWLLNLNASPLLHDCSAGRGALVFRSVERHGVIVAIV